MTEPDDVGENNRAGARAPFRIAATLRDRTSNKFNVHLLDLSTSGFRATCPVEGRVPDVAGLVNWNSSISDEATYGTCSVFEARETPIRV